MAVARALPQAVLPLGHIAVAFSGGRDSTALLHATCRAARGSHVTVHALHVHHGLSAQADAWLAHCRTQCARWARAGYPVAFHAERVSVTLSAGDSLEAQAREQRYAALARLARACGCDTVLMAHHREDQAETVLLQALRGAGVAGLAAMPREAAREGLQWIRPWLNHPRAAINAYVRRHRLAYVDDDSNADTALARNRLRLAVWPSLVAAFPHAAQALIDVARQAQDALDSVETLAEQDVAHVAAAANALDLAAWQALGPGRGRHVLRAWLHRLLGRPAPRSLIERLSRELTPVATGVWPVATGALRAYRGRLTWHSGVPHDGLAFRAAPATPMRLSITAPGRYALPAWQGVLQVAPVAAQGVAPATLASVWLHPRGGAERFQRAPNTPPRALKKQYQLHAVPTWQRGGPLLYVGGQLLYVPGLGVDARHWPPNGSPQWGLQWLDGQPEGDAPP